MSNIKNTIVLEKDSSPGQYRKFILSSIKHDLTNPINAILGYSELIMDIAKDENNKILKKDMHTIHESGALIHSYINEIFSYKQEVHDDNIEEILNNNELHFSIRTPLSSIIGLSELIMNDINTISDKNIPDIEDSIKKIASAGKHLLHLLNELKSYANCTIDELMEKYKPDLISKEASKRLFDFNPDVNIPAETGTILVVEDELNNLELLEKILKQSDNTVLKAGNASDAMKVIADKSNDIDLILLDLIMPGINGMEFLQKLKANVKFSHIPVIMQSALDELETIIECITLGADDYLIKPVNKVLLKAKVNNILEKKHFRDKEIKYQNKIKMEMQKSDALLLNILPSTIAQRLKNGETLIADDFKNATVLFADLKGFTGLSSKISAKELLMLLNNIFSEFDELLVKHSLEKIKTIGDSYMLAGGVPDPSANHAKSVAEMALDMLDVMPKINKIINHSLVLRIGINSGPVSAGVIGKKKFIYDLWGDTVNVASRMESYGRNGHIHISEATYYILKDLYQVHKCKKQDIAGKGSMQTYFLTGRL